MLNSMLVLWVYICMYRHKHILVDSISMQPNTGIFPRNYDPDDKEDNFLGKLYLLIHRVLESAMVL